MFRRALAVLSLIAAPALVGKVGAQDLLEAARNTALDWKPWEAAFGRPTKASLRALGLCDQVVNAFPDDFHFVDVDGDGKADLIYSGSFVECHTSHESDRTIIYLNVDGRLRRVFSETGRMVRLWRDAPWHAVGFVLRSDGGMDDHYLLYTYLPRRLGGEWTFQLATILSGNSATVLPSRAYPSARPFTVAQDRYNLRSTPAVDDTTTHDMEETKGNVLGAYAKGSRGMALAERADSTGRTWWFVIMQGNRIGRPMPKGYPGPIMAMGWMSSRFLTRDSTAATGPIDTTGAARRLQ